MEKQFTDLTKLKRSQYKLINGGCDDYFRVRIVFEEENDNVNGSIYYYNVRTIYHKHFNWNVYDSLVH